MRLALAFLLLLSAISLALGVTLPIVQFKRLYFFEDTPSLVGLFIGLWAEGDTLVALAIAVFSLIFPALKLALVFIAAIAPETPLARSPLWQFAGALSRWSLMDVLLVALVIFAAKTSGLAEAIAQPGLWFYAVSALSGAAAAALIKRTNAP
ncbi:MAG: paraquat-inducible protein A [Pseudomonadota bacterium]